ncbi:MAG: ribosome-associated translation inhibitor RaiA [Lentisphaeria bacterium]|nr:ribosome-associated translation inhibitor RaiA [Lentisphaeria bacterium]
MELIISGKHFEIDDELRQIAETSAARLEESYAKLSSLRLVLSKERNWQIADVILNGKNISLVAKAKSNDIRVSITSVFEKLDKQLRRYMEKIKDNAVKPDPITKEKIWTSAELKEDQDDLDLLAEDEA